MFTTSQSVRPTDIHYFNWLIFVWRYWWSRVQENIQLLQITSLAAVRTSQEKEAERGEPAKLHFHVKEKTTELVHLSFFFFAGSFCSHLYRISRRWQILQEVSVYRVECELATVEVQFEEGANWSVWQVRVFCVLLIAWFWTFSCNTKAVVPLQVFWTKGTEADGLPVRKRGDSWTDWITVVNTKGWALFIVIFFFHFCRKMVTALPERERGDNWTDWITVVNTKGWALYCHLFFYFCRKMVTALPERERERERWQLDWLDHCCKHQGMGTLYRHLFFYFCRDGTSYDSTWASTKPPSTSITKFSMRDLSTISWTMGIIINIIGCERSSIVLCHVVTSCEATNSWSGGQVI